MKVKVKVVCARPDTTWAAGGTYYNRVAQYRMCMDGCVMYVCMSVSKK